MKRGHELGRIVPGYLADLLLIDDDPLQDVRHLPDKKRLSLVMKRGARYRPCEGAPHVRHLHQSGCCIAAAAVAESRGDDLGS